jgi:hypothetical protein
MRLIFSAGALNKNADLLRSNRLRRDRSVNCKGHRRGSDRSRLFHFTG